MALKPWYTVVTPREDLRKGTPLDASEFAVHLDHVRRGTAPDDYTNPERFFGRTYLTKSLLDMASQVAKRLNGITTETSPIFNLSTQFGGGKTHSLTFLYHLAKVGKAGKGFIGIPDVLARAGVEEVPVASTAVFVGTEFSSVNGRTEGDGPQRLTPWGEIAYQIGGIQGYELLREFDLKFIAPGGDDLDRLFRRDTPYLILMDELLSYVSRHRKHNELGSQFYHFIQTLSEFVKGRTNIVLAVSLPKSEIEMTEEDQADFDRLKKMLDRVGKAIMLSEDKETAQIVRRRLFDWYGLPDDAKKTISAYTSWVTENRSHISESFDVNHAHTLFESTYPFHPQVLSLFERKWQSLPRFQQTRGALRLLALWVSRAYNEGYRHTSNEPLITLGTAPIEYPVFRAAVFEQLGENRLEVAITADIAGKDDSHAIRLDTDASSDVRKYNLHRKIATIIFFESNGGQTKEGLASIPEIKFSIGRPDFDIGHIDNAITSLLESCYYLTAHGNKYKFSTKENLQKRFNDRKASVREADVVEYIESEVKKQFEKTKIPERVIFPNSSSDIIDRAVLTLVIMRPSLKSETESALEKARKFIKEYGQSHRTYKNALIFALPEKESDLRRQAIKFLAWEALEVDAMHLNLEPEQLNSIKANKKKAETEMIETIWKCYSTLAYLDKTNSIASQSLGLLHSSQASSLSDLYMRRLEADGKLTMEVSPNLIVRSWPPAFKEWSTLGLRDTFYASPLFPKLVNQNALKTAIVKGVQNGFLAYVGKNGFAYEPFYFKQTISESEIEISEDMYILRGSDAEQSIAPPTLTSLNIVPKVGNIIPGSVIKFDFNAYDQNGERLGSTKVEWLCSAGNITQDGEFTAPVYGGDVKLTVRSGEVVESVTFKVFAQESQSQTLEIPQMIKPIDKPVIKEKISWSGEIPRHLWMIFYTKVLGLLQNEESLKIKVSFEVEMPSDQASQKKEDISQAVKDLGLKE